MWTITKIVADFEGWWLFDDWKTYITEEESFNTYDEMIEEYSSKIYTAIDKYDNYIVGKYNIYAFYNNCDLKFCKHCDEDLQIFHSYIILKNNNIYYNLPIIE